MFCKFCGCEIADDAQFCTNCGKSLQWTENYTDTAAVSPMEEEFIGKFSSKNFGIATILLTVATALSFVAGILANDISIPIFNIFAIIAFWQLKNKAENQSPLASFASSFKILRIINVIQRVLLWIVVGAFGVSGVLMVAVGASFDETFAESFIEGFNEGAVDLELGGFENIFGSVTDNIFIIIIIMGAVFVILAAVVAIFAATMYGTFVKCAKQYEDTANSGVNVITKQNSARVWLIVMAVFSILSAVGSLGVSNAAEILALAGEVCNIVFLFFMINVLKEDNLQ